MSLKICGGCTTPYAHSLTKCPNCTSTEFAWQHEVSNQIELANAVEALAMQRPKDGDKVEAWRTYAKMIVDAAGNPEDAPEVDKLTKPELIELFG